MKYVVVVKCNANDVNNTRIQINLIKLRNLVFVQDKSKPMYSFLYQYF